MQLHKNCTNDNLMKKVSSQTGIIGTRSIKIHKGSHLSFFKIGLDFADTEERQKNKNKRNVFYYFPENEIN